MKYMGSKARHAKEILPIILAGRKPGQWYVEPFVGGANVIEHVPGLRIGSDIHPHLIEMWQAVVNGWVPPKFVSEDEYANLSRKRNVDAMTGYVGFALSFGGKFFGGYRRDVAGTKGCKENMVTQSRRASEAMERQSFNLRGVKFRCGSYTDIDIPHESIIYCDPPYAGTTKYSTGSFDHDAFWRWCDACHEDGHSVFVSEYTAPAHWRCVWEKAVNSSLTRDTGGKKGIEKLFVRLT